VTKPFFLLVPGWARLPLVVLATAAAVIASQAVISGAFSMSRQAMQLGFLPPLSVRQTSRHEVGQIYLPVVNAAMFSAVLMLMLIFQSSQRLATAYGVSVTVALLIDTVLLLVVAEALFGWRTWQLAVAAIAFGGTEATFLAANMTKVFHGGWLPLVIAAVMFTVMTTWQKGARHRHRYAEPGRGAARRVRPAAARHPGHAGAGHRHLPAPHQGDHPAGTASQRQAQPGPARARHHRVGHHPERPPRSGRSADQRR